MPPNLSGVNYNGAGVVSIGSIYDTTFGESPDLVIYSHVLEHLLTPNAELQTIRNLLSDRGCLYIEVPGVKNLWRTYDMDFLKLLQNAHTYHFTLTSLHNLLRRNGFELFAGDEGIYSIFKKHGSIISNGGFSSDYSEAVLFLQQMERARTHALGFPRNMGDLTRSVIAKSLKAIGLLEYAQGLYHRK